MSAALALPRDMLAEIHIAVMNGGLSSSRAALLAGINAHFVASMPVSASPSAQVLVDLHLMNQVGALADGTVPLAIWLANAAALAGPRRESRVFENALRALSRQHPDAGIVSMPPSPPAAGPSGWSGPGTRVFLAYAATDERFAQQLLSHLNVLTRQDLLSVWHPGEISVGTETEKEIREHLYEAAIVLVLVSADLLASSYWYEAVVKGAARLIARGARVVPILARPCDFWSSPLGQLSPLPTTGEPISTFRDTDVAFTDVVRALRGSLMAASAGPSATPRSTPPWPALRVDDVFRPGGAPDATYVEPDQFARLAAALRDPGRVLVVEGPSGIGKTTAVRRALAGDTRTRWIHALKRSDVAALDQILGADDLTHGIVIDDFHRLSEERKREVGDFLKLVVDASNRKAKVTIIGVSDARQPLFRWNRDLAGRVDTISFTRQPDGKVRELVQRGEARANVRFRNREDLVLAARGSFLVAQLLCLEAAKSAGVEETSPQMVEVDVATGVVVGRVMSALRGAFDPVLLDFAASDGDEPSRGVCFALLWMLAKAEEGSVRFKEIGYRVEELRDAVSRVTASYLAQRAPPELLRYLYFAPDVVSIEDPQIAFYLRHLHWMNGWEDLADRAGLFVRIDEVGQLHMSVQRVATTNIEEVKPQPLLDIRPFPWWHAGAVELFELLLQAYPSTASMREMAERAGIQLDAWDDRGAPRDVWRTLIEQSARQGRLRVLVESVVLYDHRVRGYHQATRAAAELPGGVG